MWSYFAVKYDLAGSPPRKDDAGKKGVERWLQKKYKERESHHVQVDQYGFRNGELLIQVSTWMAEFVYD